MYNKSGKRLEELELIYQDIMKRMEELSESGEIDEYTRHCIIDMSKKVLEHIAAKHEHVKEGVGRVMGGKVLDYEAKRIYNEGVVNAYVSLIKDGIITLAEAAKRLNMSEDQVRSYM